MIGPVYKKNGSYFQLLATGVLEGPPDTWWKEVIVLQMLDAPWGVVVMEKERLDDLEEVADGELVVLGREAYQSMMREAEDLGRFTP